MPIKLYYFYDPGSGELSGSKAAVPGEKPENATTQIPPAVGANQVVIWGGKKWKVVPDYRKTHVWDKTTSQPVKLSVSGKLPAGLTEKAPSSRWSRYDQKKKVWITDKQRWLEEYIRPKRNRLLMESDKFMLPDFPLTEEKRKEWENYRQALRNLTTCIEPEQEKWPEAPV